MNLTKINFIVGKSSKTLDRMFDPSNKSYAFHGFYVLENFHTDVHPSEYKRLFKIILKSADVLPVVLRTNNLEFIQKFYDFCSDEQRKSLSAHRMQVDRFLGGEELFSYSPEEFAYAIEHEVEIR